MRRWSATAFTLLALTSGGLSGAAFADRDHSGGPASRDGGTFRIAVNDFDSIDPTISDRPGSVMAATLTCARLFTHPDKRPGPGYRLVPEVAAGYPSVSDGGKLYRFRIKPSFRFSSGERVTAGSYKRALNRVRNPRMRARIADTGIFDDIVGARAVRSGEAATARGITARSNTLTIQLKRRVGDFTARMALPASCPAPPGLPINPEGVSDLPGSGPYYVAKYVRGQKVIIRKNPEYDGGRSRHVKEYVITIDESPKEIISKIEQNAIDWSPEYVIPPLQGELAGKYGVTRSYSDAGSSRFFVHPSAVMFYLFFNTSRRPFKNNVKLRQAVNLAIDRTALARVGGRRYYGSPTDQYLPRSFSGFSNARVYPGPNLRKAVSLAGRAQNSKVNLYCLDLADFVERAQMIKKSLKRIGLDVTITPFPTSNDEFIKRISTRGEPFDMVLSGWSYDWFDPAQFLDPLFNGRHIRATGNTNFSYFDSPKFNRRLDRAARLTGTARYQAYRMVDMALAKDAAPAAALWNRNNITFVSNRVGCKHFNAEGLDIGAVCLRR